MTHEIVMAGFGGQGVMLIGQLMTYAGMMENRHVSWIPAYGPEMRGGTANCSVIVSTERIGAPIVTEPTTVVAMNQPSLDKFEPMIRPGGTMVINCSLVARKIFREDVKAFLVPANDIAGELGSKRAANMVMLGAVIAVTSAVKAELVLDACGKMFAARPELKAINEKALLSGFQLLGNHDR